MKTSIPGALVVGFSIGAFAGIFGHDLITPHQNKGIIFTAYYAEGKGSFSDIIPGDDVEQAKVDLVGRSAIMFGKNPGIEALVLRPFLLVGDKAIFRHHKGPNG